LLTFLRAHTFLHEAAEVLNRVITLIPGKECELLARLEAVKESCFYTPPECMGNMWRRVASVLEAAIPFPPKETWHRAVFKEFTTKDPPPVEEQ
jgi:hypothetical protein